MPRQLPTDDAESHDYIQFRGPQTSVVHDPTGIRFATETRGGVVAHEPHPVVDDDADPDDVADDAVARAVAEELAESNPMVCWGVACEICGDVFDTPRGLTSHQSAHDTDADEDGDDDADDAGDDGGDADAEDHGESIEYGYDAGDDDADAEGGG
jgi:hypothetical protein